MANPLVLKLRSPYVAGAGIGILGWLAIALMPASAQAQPRFQQSAGWTVFQGASGLNVNYPAGIFNVSAGSTEKGVGRKFRSEDGRYEFSAYSLANAENDTPRSYLRKNLLVAPESLVYRRVTDRFFVMSSFRNQRIFYSRCNFASGIHCIFLEYPQADKAAWDGIVTRMSYSLGPR